MKYKINVNLEKTARNSSIELLRIFSMLLIIGHHALYHGCSESLIFATDFRTLFIQGFSAFGSLGNYILKAVTEGVSYDCLRTRLDMPCCKDAYYNLYRRFFWLLSMERQ